ncbi:hypothetical protein HN011_008934 [Eciton burchellii]|nr:hypothetical protein HN011_008934 [Eciton burchellii]
MHSHANCLMILRGPVTHSTLNARGVSVRPEISSGRELFLDSSPLGRVIKSDCVTGDKPSPRLSAVNPTQVFLHSPIRDVGPSAEHHATAAATWVVRSTSSNSDANHYDANRFRTCMCILRASVDIFDIELQDLLRIITTRFKRPPLQSNCSPLQFDKSDVQLQQLG